MNKIIRRVIRWLGDGILWLNWRFNCNAPPKSEGANISYTQPGDGGKNLPDNQAE